MTGSYISSFTPSMMSHESLEQLFVQREALVNRLADLVFESVTTPAKHHTLLIGPRGIGKTHLVSLVYHRLRARKEVAHNLTIAWLREEEWGVTSFVDLLLRIIRSLIDDSQDASVKARLEGLYGLSGPEAEYLGRKLLQELVGKRTLLLIFENAEDLFHGLGDTGQKKFRAFIQETSFVTILATAQSLFTGVSRQTSPFFGFFRVEHLQELSLDSAIEFLIKIAVLRGDSELKSYLATPAGRARVRAVHHLAGGNHRVYVIFSQFLTRHDLTELVTPLMRTIDELTPYYQSRIAQLSPQQRKIVELLSDVGGAVTVREIARRSFITQQTASGQLRLLRELGYVRVKPVGRESYYELREPLLRLCVEVKKARGRPISLLVNFLRVWHSKAELSRRLSSLHKDQLEWEYVRSALDVADGDEPTIAACLEDIERHGAHGEYSRAVEAAEDLIALRGDAADWIEYCHALTHVDRWADAVGAADKAIGLGAAEPRIRYYKARALTVLRRLAEAESTLREALAIDPNYSVAWAALGDVLDEIERHEDALAAYRRALDLQPKNARLWMREAMALVHLGRHDEALASAGRARELSPNEAEPWAFSGWILDTLTRHEEALAMYERAVKLSPTTARYVLAVADQMFELGRYDAAVAAADKATEMAPQEAEAWDFRGLILTRLERVTDALASFDKAIEIDPKLDAAWHKRGWALSVLQRFDDAVASYDKAMEFGDTCPELPLERAEALLAADRWDEGLAELSPALERVPSENVTSTGALAAAVQRLFATGNVVLWKRRLAKLVEVLSAAKSESLLGNALVRTLSELSKGTVTTAVASTWVAVVREAIHPIAGLTMPIGMLDAGVKFHETKDERILLALPAEQRSIVESFFTGRSKHRQSTKAEAGSPSARHRDTRVT